MPRCPRWFWLPVTLALSSGLLVTRPSFGRPGTHAPAISTWDTRASSVVLHGQGGFLEGGHFHNVGYNANFTSTSGNISAQFGLHYLTLQVPELSVQHGFAASAVGLLSIPLTDRFDDGVPVAALGLYLGAVPSALVSGRWNDLTFPFVMGTALPLSPASEVTFTPWLEFSPSVNLDTVINPYFFETPLDNINDLDDLEDFINRSGGQITGIQDISVRKILEQSVQYRVTTVVGARGGLTIGLHASETMDLNLGLTVGSFGSAFSGPTFVQVGGGLVIRWDDIVPAVLPADRRLMNEDCGAVARRHFACEAKAKSSKPRPPVMRPVWSPPPQRYQPPPQRYQPPPQRYQPPPPPAAQPPTPLPPPPSQPAPPPGGSPPSSAFPPAPPTGAGSPSPPAAPPPPAAQPAAPPPPPSGAPASPASPAPTPPPAPGAAPPGTPPPQGPSSST